MAIYRQPSVKTVKAKPLWLVPGFGFRQKNDAE
jgi:hypothetical protein